MQLIRLLVVSCLLLSAAQTYASQLVLVQGYLGGPSSWSDSGIAQLLDANGWDYSGEFVYGREGAVLLTPRFIAKQQTSKNKFYRVSLPTESAIQSQGFYLMAYLKKLREIYPHQDIILVGHSAGGVVARYVMVKQPQLKIKMLITIASPHLGTDIAELGKLAGNSPLAFVAPMIGVDTINRSQGLYSDLLPEMPHRFLYWLNRQPHPEAEYISIVRDRQSSEGGDFIVAEKSQHLENVYSLRYRAISYIVQGGHGLSVADGRLLLDLINTRNLPRQSVINRPKNILSASAEAFF